MNKTNIKKKISNANKEIGNGSKIRGITLISLVFTIIILLILAAITIGVLTGENGLFKKTKEATELNDYTTAKEQLIIKLMEVQTECMALNKEYNIGAIAEYFGENQEVTVEIIKYYTIGYINKNIEEKPEINKINSIVVSLEKYKKYKFLIGGNCQVRGVTVGSIGEEDEFIEIAEFENRLKNNEDIDIDIVKPTAKVENMELSEYLFGIKATVKISDEGSGLDFDRCKYVFTESQDKLGVDESLYTDGNINEENAIIESAKGIGTWYLHVLAIDKSGNKIEAVSESAITTANAIQNYNYTGNVVIAKLLPGKYQFECWGAEGGRALGNNTYNGYELGGKGGYSIGEYTVKNKQEIYIAIGGKGANGTYQTNAVGGYNGGGNATWDYSDDESSGAGGGATHIAINNNRGQLENYKDTYMTEILMIAGGGGGASFSYPGADGGGLEGGSNQYTPSAATQTTGNTFGRGKDGVGVADSDGVAGGRRRIVWRPFSKC